MSDKQHTPEPWRWEFNAKNRSVLLVGGKPQFDKTVMQFSRWGTQGAGPMFNAKIAGNLWNIMERLCDQPDWIAPFKGREHHADWCANVTHPDARRIVACVNACEGIPTDDLDAGSVAELAQLAGEKLNALTKQRDEALEAKSQYQALLADMTERCHAAEKQRNELLAALDVIIPALESRANGDSYLSSDQFNAVRKCRYIKSDAKGGAA